MNKEKQILIIGNGNSILNSQFGKIIDTFSNVARINNYSISGYQNFVGSKTDIWFHGANQGVKIRNILPSRVVILVPPKILKQKGSKIYSIIKKRQKLNLDEFELVPEKQMLKYENLCSIERITTGTNSILWALDNFNEVIIHGFDFFYFSKTHYFDNKILKWLINNNIIKKGVKHSIEKEKIYIENLISNGIIKKLTDFISKK